MKIPSCFYGTRQEAKKECAKVARKILKGETLLDAVAAYEMIDTKEVKEGCLMLKHPFHIRGNEKHFCLTLVADNIYKKWEPPSLCENYDTEREKRESIFSQFIENDWSILGLSEGWWLYTSHGRINDNRHRWQPYLQKLCDFWDVINNEGKRYDDRVDYKKFPEANRLLMCILSYMGFSIEEIDRWRKQPSPDLKALCDKYNLLTMDVYNDLRILEEYRLKD